MLCGNYLLAADPLPSWNDGKAKQQIIEFVNRTVKAGSDGFIEEKERIAVFDNDGTLWCEQPFYFQGFFAFDRIKTLAPQHPEWKEKQPFAAVLNNDKKALAQQGEHALTEILAATHAGMTSDEFHDIVADWLKTSRHPKYNKPYNKLVYRPMLELLDYLRANGFKTYIVSGGGVDFIRVFAEQTYGIPPEQVIGSSIRTKFNFRGNQPVIERLPAVDFIDDKEGKPVGIHKFIGRRPVLAFGNSDGDLQMLQWTAARDHPSLMLIVHHDDAEREYAYDRDSHIGTLNKALDEANTKGWTVVSMKHDWKNIFPE